MRSKVIVALKTSLKIALLTVVLFLFAAFGKVIVYKDKPVTNTYFMESASEKHGVKTTQQWLDIGDISKQLQLAVICSEDREFYEHHGFNFRAIKAAWENNNRDDKKLIMGGSSITQQTAKNVFLWEGRTWMRKFMECIITPMLELAWGKERIMEVYLNIIEFAPGVYGAEAASQKFFGHSADKITQSEAALLAAVMPAPSKRSILNPDSCVIARQSEIIASMSIASLE